MKVFSKWRNYSTCKAYFGLMCMLLYYPLPTFSCFLSAFTNIYKYYIKVCAGSRRILDLNQLVLKCPLFLLNTLCWQTCLKMCIFTYSQSSHVIPYVSQQQLQGERELNNSWECLGAVTSPMGYHVPVVGTH